MMNPSNETDAGSRPRLFRFAVVFALICGGALAALCWSLPLPTGGNEEARKAPSFLLFIGRFHPILVHFPVAMLSFTAILRGLTLLPLGRALRPALTLCLWFVSGAAVVTASAGWLLAQEGGYSGPVFALHWKCGLIIASLSLSLLVLYHANFRGALEVQLVVWVATLGVLGFGAHQGGTLTRGETYLTEYAPDWLRPLMGGGEKKGSGATKLPEDADPGLVAASAVFKQYCTECHGESKSKGDQRLHTPEGIAKGGKSGPGVVPGKPDESLILKRLLLPGDDKKHMPPEGKSQPTPQEIVGLRQWIASGAAGLPTTAVTGQHAASTETQSGATKARLDQQPGDGSSTARLGAKTNSPNPATSDPMNIRTAAAQTAILLASTTAGSAQNPDGLAGDVLKIFKARCIECHGKASEDPDEFAFIDDLAKLRTSEFVNLANPQASKIYTMVQTREMPRRTKADKDAGKKKADPLTDDQVAAVLSWLSAGAPDGSGTTPAVIATNTTPTPPAGNPTTTNPPKPPTLPARVSDGTLADSFPDYPKVTRKLVTPQEEIVAALSDLQTVAREEQADTRYVSLASAHNNAHVSKDQLENLRRGVRKLLNSLSTGSRVMTFTEAGPEKVLFRVRLRDIGWDAAMWDNVASHFPQAIDTGVSSALGTACHTTVPILRADWMAANVARPPLYHDVLKLPKLQQELEKELGIDLVANLQSGEAVRSGLVKSGISLANRMIERHEARTRGGYYWASYDFRSSGGKANLLENPLGPESAKLAGGAHSFKHVGGEIVFTLPNGFHGYYLSDVAGHRLDGAAPTDIVGDRTNVTGRVEISNGLSCMICHDKGIKAVDSPDAVRTLASKFSADEQRLIERLHPVESKIQAVLKEDGTKFLAALKSANAEPISGQPEPIGALAALNDREVSLETAAAEIGLSPEDLAHKLEDQNQLLALRALFKNGGTLQREHFLDYFSDLVQRLDIGIVRSGATPIATVPLPGRFAQAKPIAVELKTDKTTYTEGDDIVITVQAAESGHLRLLYQNSKGEIYTLFPNQFIDNDKIEGGKLIKVVPTPNPKKAGDEVAIVVSGPNFGTEYLAAIVTDQPFTDEKALHDQLKNTQFAKSAARNIEGAVTKEARVISRPAREGGTGGARAGFARVTLTTVKKP